jgi:hypothetical protein
MRSKSRRAILRPYHAKQDVLEKWTGMRLKPVSCYGIRTYKEGHILSPHVDRSRFALVSPSFRFVHAVHTCSAHITLLFKLYLLYEHKILESTSICEHDHLDFRKTSTFKRCCMELFE